jgi:ATP/maltotriose-dependent transcriptional regulator MalT/DNA-binding SARP family transcriptional activator
MTSKKASTIKGASSPSLAKLTRPKLHGTVPRTRLFAELDVSRQRPVTWISAPPGSGKSTLVASYIEARELRDVWYQVDSGDTDPATFFYYLGLAILKLAPKERKPLPLLTPEFLSDIPAFARRYFRDFFGRLPKGSLFVIDNYHEVPAETIFHAVVAEAFFELPEGINAIVVSRSEPPVQFARLAASDRSTLMDWQSLRLTMDETRAITLLRHPVDELALSKLYQQSDGWAAGLTLMLERLRRNGTTPESVDAETREAVFDYFAGEIFDKTEPENQQILISTALLPRVTVSMAEKVSLQASAGKLLEYLYRRHLFTDRRLGIEPTYHYHDLFRTFLLAKAKEVYAPAGLAQLTARAAKLLEESGNGEDAIALYMDAKDWPNAARVLLGCVPALLFQGRGQTLRERIARFPAEVHAVSPWLSYWHGVSMVASQPGESMGWIEKASVGFDHSSDRLGQALCAAAMIHSIFLEWSDLTKMDPWIDKLKSALDNDFEFPRAEMELHVYSSALISTFNRRPRDPLLGIAAKRVQQLLAPPLNPDLRVTAGMALLLYYLAVPEDQLGSEVIDMLEPAIKTGLVSPLNLMYWHLRKGVYLGSQDRFNEAVASIEHGEALAKETGLGLGTVVAYMPRMTVMPMLGDVDGAKLGVAYMERAMVSSRKLDLGFLNFGRANLCGMRGEYKRAAEIAQEARKQMTTGGMFYSQSGLTILAAAYHALDGDFATASERLEEATALTNNTYLSGFEPDVAIIEGLIALRHGDRERCGILLKDKIIPAAAHGKGFFTRLIPALHAEIYSEALKQDIETQTVRALIKQRRLKPLSNEIVDWPWVVAVRALGDFSIEADAFNHQGKSRYRLLEFLKILMALGGVAVNATSLIELLWPDSEGDAAQRVFHTSLHRLRKLLGDDRTILLEDGKLSLNLDLCWSDVTAFDHLSKRIENGLPDIQNRVEQGERLLDLYRGPLLHQEGDKPWILGPRDRLSSRFRRAVGVVGENMERMSLADPVIAFYRKALERDNLAEDIYRRLMICHQRQGERAEALNVYRRCRELLSIVLGVEPSPHTQKVFESLKQTTHRTH